MKEKRILVAAPTNERHSYVFEEWLDRLEEQTIPVDVLVVYTGSSDEYARYLESKNVKVLYCVWDPKKTAIVQHLAHARELYRLYAVKNNYDYLFHLDTDIIIPVDGVEELMAFDKDQVGYCVHVYPKGQFQPLCVFKDGRIMFNRTGKSGPNRNGLRYYSWSWYSKYKGQLKKVYGTGLGVLLCKRKVFENVHFRTHPTFVNGEDLWYYSEADDKGYEAWCYLKRVPHKNASWDGITCQEEKRTSIYFAFGPANAKGVEVSNAN